MPAPRSLRWPIRDSVTTGVAAARRPTGRFGDPAAATGPVGGASDLELAHALCAHDIAALDEAFRRPATRVAFTVRAVAGASYIDDVVQDVFLALWRGGQRFDPERASLAGYLAVSARSRTLARVHSDGTWHRRHRDHHRQPAPVGGIRSGLRRLEPALSGMGVRERD